MLHLLQACLCSKTQGILIYILIFNKLCPRECGQGVGVKEGNTTQLAHHKSPKVRYVNWQHIPICSCQPQNRVYMAQLVPKQSKILAVLLCWQHASSGHCPCSKLSLEKPLHFLYVQTSSTPPFSQEGQSNLARSLLEVMCKTQSKVTAAKTQKNLAGLT